jgi:hypothetical protein
MNIKNTIALKEPVDWRPSRRGPIYADLGDGNLIGISKDGDEYKFWLTYGLATLTIKAGVKSLEATKKMALSMYENFAQYIEFNI